MVDYKIRSKGRIVPKKLQDRYEEIGNDLTTLVGKVIVNAVVVYFGYVLVRVMDAVVVGIVVH